MRAEPTLKLLSGTQTVLTVKTRVSGYCALGLPSLWGMTWFLVLPHLLLLCHGSSSRRAFQQQTQANMQVLRSPEPASLPVLCTRWPWPIPWNLWFNEVWWIGEWGWCHVTGYLWGRSELDESLSSLKSVFLVYFPRLWKSLVVVELQHKESNAMCHFWLKESKPGPSFSSSLYVHLKGWFI